VSDGVELCLPWDVTDDGDDHVIASVREPVEIARIPYGQGADDVAAFIVRAANEHIGLTRALHRVEGEAQAQRARADAAEAEVARLRSLLDVTARELVAARAAAEGWREEATGLRAIVEGRDVAPTAQEIDAHDGAWVVRYLRPRDPKRGERVAFCGAGWRQNARDMAAQHETTWWLPLDREGRPTAWPVPA